MTFFRYKRFQNITNLYFKKTDLPILSSVELDENYTPRILYVEGTCILFFYTLYVEKMVMSQDQMPHLH